MTKLVAQTILGSAGLLAAGAVAATGHNGWGWILLVALIFVADA